MAEKKQGTFRTTIGGQALIEGILMRGPEKDAIVVRAPEGLVTKVTERKFIKDKYPILGLPIIRGADHNGVLLRAAHEDTLDQRLAAEGGAECTLLFFCHGMSFPFQYSILSSIMQQLFYCFFSFSWASR